jgi:hypothetical protein
VLGVDALDQAAEDRVLWDGTAKGGWTKREKKRNG